MPKGLAHAAPKGRHVARGSRARSAPKLQPFTGGPAPTVHLNPVPKTRGASARATNTRTRSSGGGAPSYGRVPTPTGNPLAPAVQSLDRQVETARAMTSDSQVMPGVVSPLGLPAEPARSVIPGLVDLQAQQAAISPKVQLAPPVP